MDDYVDAKVGRVDVKGFSFLAIPLTKGLSGLKESQEDWEGAKHHLPQWK